MAKPDGKQPYLSAPDGGAISFAGLWDRWKNPETGEFVTSRTIIVNTLTQAIYDRVPSSSTRQTSGLAYRRGGHKTYSSQPPKIAVARGRVDARQQDRRRR